MKIKVEFNYECEIDMDQDEINDLIYNLRSKDVKRELSDEISSMFLMYDGREESGEIKNISYEVKK